MCWSRYAPHPLIQSTLQCPVSVLNIQKFLSLKYLNILGGYGSKMFNSFRGCSSSDQVEFPLTLGRDFVGEIVHKGMAVRNSLQLGQSVWGVVPPFRTGCHAEYVAVDADHVNLHFSFAQ